jgi:FtsH-binding integral membrane protein
MAMAITSAMVVGLSVYAMRTTRDFSAMGAFMWGLGFSFMMFGFLLFFFASEVMYMIYCVLGVALFSLYLIFDTQLIMGNHKYKLSPEDYVLGALILYLDIINLFLYVLELVGSRR